MATGIEPMEQTLQDLTTAEIKKRCSNLVAEIRRRENEEKLQANKAHVGKYFQSSRCYSGISEAWPVYTYVHSAEPNGLIITRFQLDFFGSITVEPNWLDTNFTPGSEISPEEYHSAWEKTLTALQAVWPQPGDDQIKVDLRG